MLPCQVAISIKAIKPVTLEQIDGTLLSPRTESASTPTGSRQIGSDYYELSHSSPINSLPTSGSFLLRIPRNLQRSYGHFAGATIAPDGSFHDRIGFNLGKVYSMGERAITVVIPRWTEES